ncbi:hypothetical protein CHS0354_027732 [Potamilus streckersoni]|uniref:ATP-grasp domain-containing protein n=1 Tax=Potamilus streckersoni TaxID=2493646 RepID=A0AAE0S7J6_9BIVA|nr:hypothetical protein CHS0354_027732 [Potamilus streckersoni]
MDVDVNYDMQPEAEGKAAVKVLHEPHRHENLSFPIHQTVVSIESALCEMKLSPDDNSNADDPDDNSNADDPDDNSNADEAPENKDERQLLNTIQITSTPERYSTWTGSYKEWSTNINLGPFREGIPIPPEDKYIMKYYESLQYMLYETGYPETVDRTSQPRTVSKDDITICMLSSPVECMSTLTEGGNQCPGNMLLVLSTTWLSKKKSETKDGFYSLYVHKAIAFGVNGQSSLETYDPPRRVTYFVNFFTRACTNGQRHDGKEVEAYLDCPMSSSLKLTKLVDDKLWTRSLVSELGLAFPETVAFAYSSDIVYPQEEPDIRVVHIDEKKTNLEMIVDIEVNKFLDRCFKKEVKMIVVKPSGIMWHASNGVTYHWIHNREEIIQVILEFFTLIDPGDAVLVETFIETIKPVKNSKVPRWRCTESCAVHLRSTVCRRNNDTAVTTNINCGIAFVEEPVTETTAILQPLRTTLIAYGVTDDDKIDRFEKDVKEASAAILDSIMSYESDLDTSERGGLFAQTDIIGIDFVIASRNGVLTPVCIEVNSHDCTINCHTFETFYPKLKKKTVGPYVETMIVRSVNLLMVGKTVLVVGGGDYSKHFIWPAAEEMGIKVVLVESDPNHFAKDDVDEFIPFDFSDHTQDDQHAMKIFNYIRKNTIKLDGCLTFWEDCVPLVARLCHLLNLPGSTEKGALIAKSKSDTLAVLNKVPGSSPHWPLINLYMSWFLPLRSQADIKNIQKVRKFPLIMKLEYGSRAVGVTLVRNAAEMEEKYNDIRSILQKPEDYSGIGLGHGNTLMVMEYLVGTEHDVDIILHERRMAGAFVSDNGPTRGKTFTETAACMPSVLSYDKQRQLIIAAYQCCLELGLKNGVFNVEFKMEATGPKLIEVNGRMGGFYHRDWIRKVYGIDVLMSAFEIACGIKPHIPDRPPRGQMMGIMCIPSLHSHILQDPYYISKRLDLEAAGKIHFNLFDQHAEVRAGGFEEPFANVAVIAEDLPTARKKLVAIAKDLNIDHPDYNVDSFLEDFWSI